MTFDFSAQFEQMRPYNNSEFAQVIERLVADPLFAKVCSYVYEGVAVQDVASMLRSMQTVDDFQEGFMHHAAFEVLRRSGSSFTYDGLENLDPNAAYLFIANHRDIVLDSTIMQAALFDNGYRTSQITFGSNLMANQFIIDLGKLNKMFTLYRGGSRIQQYRNALLHSAYMRHVICDLNESVWIAQRNGRTKDGNDKTQTALIKMLLGDRRDTLDTMMNFNIVPIVISYEWEPCSCQKVKELFCTKDGVYHKEPGEDQASVLYGLMAKKGRIHLTFGKPVNNTLQAFVGQNVDTNQLVDAVVDCIDQQVYQFYHLWPNNYIAADMLTGQTQFATYYSLAERQLFASYLDKHISTFQPENHPVIRQMFLKMYAYPVYNKLGLEMI
jgi:hypothetical protein